MEQTPNQLVGRATFEELIIVIVCGIAVIGCSVLGWAIIVQMVVYLWSLFL